MNYLYWLDQIEVQQQSLVGNKLLVLSQLLQKGCPILSGFVLASNLPQALWQNFDNSSSLLGNLPDSSLHLDVDNYRLLQSFAQQSRQIINQASLAPELIEQVLTAAQQFNCETVILHPYIVLPYQQYQGNNSLWRTHSCSVTPTALAAAIKRVWGELFTAKSLLYWQKSGLDIAKINLAVLIQPLKSANVSGLVEIERELIRIKATWGLPQSLWWGEVDPDTYIVERGTRNIIERQLGHKNYGYRLPENYQQLEEQGAINCLESCLESYIPSPTHSQALTLDDKAIAELLELTTAILQHQPLIPYLEWSLLPSDRQSSSPEQFYFTQLDYQIASPIKSVNFRTKTKQNAVKPILTGLGASPGQILADVVVIDPENSTENSILSGCILVTNNLADDRLSLLKQVAGIITESGSMTSHVAIVARELKIPALVDTTDATKILTTGMKVWLDGREGKVYAATARHQLSSLNISHSLTNESIATKLMVNLSQPETIAEAVNLPVDGVGLLRSELMLAELLASKPLEQWQQAAAQEEFLHTLSKLLPQFVAAFAPRPVFYRSLDCYAKGGNRGTYNYWLDSTLFDLELTAIASVITEGGNVNLILPFVRSVEEFKFCYRRIQNMGLTTHSSFQVWIMAEVPSVIFLLPEYINAGVQGIAIGTNDLTQLMLAVDREQSHFSNRGLNAHHPAMQRAIEQIITTVKAHDIPCSLCGQAAVKHPELIDKLIAWGISSISVEPAAVLTTYQAIARAERRLLFNRPLA